jgi:hypothetical protein
LAKTEGEYTTTKTHEMNVDGDFLLRDVWGKIMDYVGEPNNFEAHVYYDIAERCFFDVDEVIEYLQETYIEDAENREDYEIGVAKEIITILEKYKGYTIFEK